MADQSESTKNKPRRGPSMSLLIAGALALVLAIWAFAGPASMPATSMIPIGWIVVIGAIVIGVLLVLSPRKRR